MSDSINVLVDTGEISVVGPPDQINVAYDIGQTGQRGNLWFSGYGLPDELTIPEYKDLVTNDLYVDSITGTVYQYILLPSNTNDWVRIHELNVGVNIMENAELAHQSALAAAASESTVAASAASAAQSELDSAGHASEAAALATNVGDFAATATAQASLASGYATNAHDSKLAVDADQTTVTQTMADFLAMLGSDVATLTNGKLTISQVPNLAINSTFTVTNVSQITSLTAQEGDVAIVVPVDVVTDTYILAASEPTILSNWKKLGVSYVAEAGHATTADAATDSTMINGHRVVVMTQEQYDAAVKDADTVYLVSGA